LCDIVDVGCRANDRGAYPGARLEQQAVSGQLGVDDLQNLGSKPVLFEQMPKSQDAEPGSNASGAEIEVCVFHVYIAGHLHASIERHSGRVLNMKLNAHPLID